MTRDQIIDLLRDRLEELAGYLYPNGKRDGRYWRVGNAAGNPGQSFDINLETGWFGDHATNAKMSRSPIDLWMTARQVNFATAIREIHVWLGVPLNDGHDQPPFDWSLRIASVSKQRIKELASWRNYTVETCSWLKSKGICGIHNGMLGLSSA